MLLDFMDKTPVLGEGCFVADNAAVIGEVILGDDCSVWFGASVRGDSGRITIGSGSNVQDNATVHCSDGEIVTIGNRVSIGHNAIVHGAAVEDDCLIGMGAVVLDGAVIGRGSTPARSSRRARSFLRAASLWGCRARSSAPCRRAPISKTPRPISRARRHI